MLHRHPAAQASPWGRQRSGQPPATTRPSLRRRQGTPALPSHVVELAAAAAEPVAKVALLTSVGALCSRAGVLKAEGRRLISTLILNVFTPALLISKLGASVGAAEALRDWPLCANMALLSVAGLALGRAQTAVMSVPERLQSPVVVMSALGNVGNLPLVLVPTLAANPAVGHLDSEEGLRYVLLTYFWACFMQFPLAYTLFSNAARQVQQLGADTHAYQQQALAAAGAAAAAAGADPTQAASPAAGMQTAAAGTAAAAGTGNGSSASLSNWSNAAASAAVQATSSSGMGAHSSSSPSPSSNDNSTAGNTSSGSNGTAGSSSSAAGPQSASKQPSDDWALLARNVLTPPTLACIAAAVVGSFPALQHTLFTPSGGLHVLGDALALLGQPLVPCLFLVLGSNLAEGPGPTPVAPTLVLSMVVSKQLLHPLLGLGLLLGARQYGLLPPSVDALQLLVMALVWSTPTAVMVHSLATMMQVEEGSVSSLLFWQYLSALVTLPAFLLLLLELLQAGALGGA